LGVRQEEVGRSGKEQHVTSHLDTVFVEAFQGIRSIAWRWAELRVTEVQRGESFRDLLDSSVIRNMLVERCQRNEAVVLELDIPKSGF
jgi:hypothetical protein